MASAPTSSPPTDAMSAITTSQDRDADIAILMDRTMLWKVYKDVRFHVRNEYRSSFSLY